LHITFNGVKFSWRLIPRIKADAILLKIHLSIGRVMLYFRNGPHVRLGRIPPVHISLRRLDPSIQIVINKWIHVLIVVWARERSLLLLPLDPHHQIILHFRITDILACDGVALDAKRGFCVVVELDVFAKDLCFTLINNIMRLVHGGSDFPKLVLRVFNLAGGVQKRVLLLPLSDVLHHFQIRWDRHSALLAE
jgi:hypothetical protein